jgi:hypothetical protein
LRQSKEPSNFHSDAIGERGDLRIYTWPDGSETTENGGLKFSPQKEQYELSFVTLSSIFNKKGVLYEQGF